MRGMLDDHHAPYLLYVLRLWCDGPGAPWRASLECARTGERRPFADLADLFAFLESETQGAQPAPIFSKDTGHREKSQTEQDCGVEKGNVP